MIKEKISIDEVVDFLNELVRLDEPAITKLLDARVECGENFADHETLQVGKYRDVFKVGFLGVLNGLFGADEQKYGPIEAVIGRHDHKVQRFRRRKRSAGVGPTQSNGENNRV